MKSIMYNHKNVAIKEIAKQITEDGSGQRLYLTPNGDTYPSITTVLAPIKEEILKTWRDRVGNEVANFESNWGKDRGSALHLACEDLLNNKPLEGHPLLIRMLIEDLTPYLRKINNIHCQEQTLYSDKFRIGGRCDCIAEYDGKLSVIDFKGSKRTKKIEWITDYFLQVSFYAYSYYERTGYKIEQGVILIANECGQASEFIIQPWKYWSKLKDVRKQYKEKFGI
jgi:genome maintenance exonuclease 1